ncbi:DUF378 domain-containing protein [Alkaliphilus peptidifermentans]|uniref:DUF378 domain-containing protein n=1 Tax=Alkaliphilus peptidifermentans DSM 18978 TaxID=1120976 RepID=A0A1G5EM92_9FIRM|nr:DUF378 domain-containing protein [Alkaliphilus peptidifermentans]SCY27558.1 hypothetical protein SAMN03080606_01191 [Alkaliphilus peptidifermentans DSM 18978]
MFTWIALILVVIGALNWGLVGLFDIDLVAGIFRGRRTPFARLIYILIGLSGLFTLLMLFFRR